jgi:hypothetical protein
LKRSVYESEYYTGKCSDGQSRNTVHFILMYMLIYIVVPFFFFLQAHWTHSGPHYAL